MKLFHFCHKTIIVFSACCLLFNQNSFAQSQKIEAGKSAAMSNTSVTLTDIWSVYHNQAGLGFIDDISAGIFHQSGFIKQQNLQGLGFAYPTKTGTIAASYSYYGFSQYNEMQAGLAFGRSFTRYFAVGLQINYLSTRIADNYGSANTVNFEVGIRNLLIIYLLERMFTILHEAKWEAKQCQQFLTLVPAIYFPTGFILVLEPKKTLNMMQYLKPD